MSLAAKRCTEIALGDGLFEPDAHRRSAQPTMASGRVEFEADPFPSTLARQGRLCTGRGCCGSRTARRDSSTRMARRRTFVRAAGRQATVTTATDEAHEIYPTHFQRTFQNNTEVVSVQDSASLLANSPQFGVMTSSYLTAGWAASRSVDVGKAPSRLEHAAFTYDPLGHQNRDDAITSTLAGRRERSHVILALRLARSDPRAG